MTLQIEQEYYCNTCDAGPFTKDEKGSLGKTIYQFHKEQGHQLVEYKKEKSLEDLANEALKEICDPIFEEIKIRNLPELDYQKELEHTRNNLEKTIERCFQHRYFTLEVCLSVKAQLLIDRLTQPFTLILMGSPSTNKSTITDIVNSLPGCYKSDKFTPKAFVSHSANSKKEELGKVDLLPRIKHKTLITPELAPLFSGNDDNLVESFGILTRVLDGRGLQIDSGVHGQRGYKGDYYFMWIGAVVDIPHKVWKYLGNLGSRFYFLRQYEEKLSLEKMKSKIKEELKSKPYCDRLEDCQRALGEFWKYVENRHDIVESKKVVWDVSKDQEQAIDKIIELAQLLSKLRASIPTWHTNESDSGGSNYHFEMPVIEDPSRASNALYNLARGHALLYGRNFVTTDDLSVVIPVALSSASRERVTLFEYLIRNNGELTTEQFEEQAKVSRSTARKEMKKLAILDLVDEFEEEATTKPIKKIKLKKAFSWFLSQEFTNYYRIPEFSKLSLENLEKKTVCSLDEHFEVDNK